MVHGFPLAATNAIGRSTGMLWQNKEIYRWLGDPVAAVQSCTQEVSLMH
ncbi:hypothetical protein EV13_1262 [Prochlorococcus sp. MIT 0702]|nr:hypothetical protein EV12_2085 [Prochlorococcus sp. MIT 0701]KGG29108.1 hypothetical protein EV13_1262 [Prochlorococcus sp. MIT 0702]KGG32574.1 hypothetical protein EV14_2070 [Prochlorococcus sp. MIT 0703]